jgi:hypothetical protein
VARIVVGSWMIRYPMGGNLSWTLQWLVGFRRLGHDVYLVEKAGFPSSCWDPSRGIMSDDCSYGVATVNELLTHFGLQERWCFVDATDSYHGLTQKEVAEVFRTADLFVDIGTHGAWLEEAATSGLRVLVDGEPGYTQMKIENRRIAGEESPVYDYYYTNGANIGTNRSSAPSAGRPWRPIFNPVVVDLFENGSPAPDSAFTTVMNWRSHAAIEFHGNVFGQKDVEFARFVELPARTTVPMEVAVAGNKVPRDRLRECGWRVRDAHQVTASHGAYKDYIRSSRGEFSVCKNVFVATNSGWFSDRSAAYLASGRPVLLEDTGFSDHLPCGRGLFAVRSVSEAAGALAEVDGNYDRHSKWAREVAREHLDARVILRNFLQEVGI